MNIQKPKPVTNKVQLSSAIATPSNSIKNILSMPNDVLSPNAGSPLYDEAIANRSVNQKLSSLISKGKKK